MNEGQLAEELTRAAQADELLRNVIFQGAVAAVREEYTKAWQNSRGEDTAGREHAFHRLRALDEVIGKLEVTVQTGVLAKRQIEAQARLNS